MSLAAPAQEEARPIRIVPQAAGQGRQPDEQTLIANRDKKLEAAFLKKADWLTDYDKAREEAKKSGKLIFTYFSRSYAP